MNSYLPQWFTDLASISSVIGLFVSIFLFIEARKIRNSFLRRARLPEVTYELSKIRGSLTKKVLNKDKKFILEQYAIVRGLLENLAQKDKLPDNEKKHVIKFINKLQTKKWLFFNSSFDIVTEDEAWNFYTELSSLITKLEQLVKDSKWD